MPAVADSRAHEMTEQQLDLLMTAIKEYQQTTITLDRKAQNYFANKVFGVNTPGNRRLVADGLAAMARHSDLITAITVAGSSAPTYMVMTR